LFADDSSYGFRHFESRRPYDARARPPLSEKSACNGPRVLDLGYAMVGDAEIWDRSRGAPCVCEGSRDESRREINGLC